MKRLPLVFIAVLAVVGFVWWWSLHKPQGSDYQSSSESAKAGGGEISQQALSAQVGESSRDPSAPDPASTVDKTGMIRLMKEALDAMRKGEPGEIRRSLARLDDALGGRGDQATAIAAIMEFLRTGADAKTGMGFLIGEGGVLQEPTTLRVYLMDRLGRLCRETGSGEALEMGRQTLATFGSPDEWAISMRNVAWSDPASSAFLDERVNAMLRRPQWQEHPTTGMLEAFDVIVHTGSMEAVPELARQISLQESALGRASGVALDRLATSHSLELTTLLNRKHDLMAATPMVRADLFAHADLAVPEQRSQLETYLLRPDVDAVEREKFFSSLIQTGQFVSHNLITPFIPPEEPAKAADRLGTLVETVNGWMRDARFGAISGELSAFGEAVNGIIDEISADDAAGGQK